MAGRGSEGRLGPLDLSGAGEAACAKGSRSGSAGWPAAATPAHLFVRTRTVGSLSCRDLGLEQPPARGEYVTKHGTV
jgi:hypothetical protein